MLAVLKDIPIENNISIKNVDQPSETRGYLIIEVKASGICGSDLHAYHWTKNYQKRYDGCLPVILGHEFAGVVKSIGKDVNGFTLGEKVVARPGISCGKCYCCIEGNDGICQNRKILGVHFNGAMSEYVAVPFNNCYKLPENCSLQIGAIFEPINVAYNAVLKAGSLLGKDVVVIGPGPLSYFISLFVEASGAKSIIINGLSRDKVRMQKFADVLNEVEISYGENMLFKIVADKTHKKGVDVVFEVSGSIGGFQDSLNIIRKNGLIVLVGIIPELVSVDTNLLVRGEVIVKGALGASSRVWEEVIRYMASLTNGARKKFEKVVTHQIPLKSAEEAFKIAEAGIGLKVLLSP